MGSPREVELKLAVPNDAIGALANHPALQTDRPVEHRHQVTTYFDTPDHALARRGLSLRIRCDGDRRVQTLKADRKAGVAADRAEWESPIEQPTPDLGLLAKTAIAGMLPHQSELNPVSITDIHRTLRIIELHGGATRIEAVLDQGEVIAGEAREPVRELELELRQGEPAALYRLALELHAAVPLTVMTESKAARGYRLCAGEAAAVHKAPETTLHKDTSAASALRDIVAAGLGHLLVNRPAALAGDAEGVHQMRVAIRRLRAALTFFRPHLEPHATSRFEAELRRIGQVFGEARDWDVFNRHILPQALHGIDTAHWRDLLLPLARVCRDTAHRRFATEVASPGFTALVLGLAAWSEQGRDGGRLLGDADMQRPIKHVAPLLLDRLAHKVKRRGRHIDGADADRHALRKSLKKLRYAIDYVESIYPGKARKSYVHACKKLQQTLGDINDSVMALKLADRIGNGTSPGLAPAIGALAVQLARQRNAGLHDLDRHWHDFTARSRFWI